MSRLARTLLASAVLALASAAQAPVPGASCATCHGAIGVAETAGAHAAAGVGCVQCHGGVEGPMEAGAAHGTDLRVMSEARAGVELCGACHADAARTRGSSLRADQRLLYDASAHGRRLAQEEGARVATCVTCHGAHGVLPASDPRSPVHPSRQPDTCGACHSDAALMASYGRSSDAPEQFRASAHGRALLERGAIGSPTCTTCHGSHGAGPPEIGRTCGGCHAPARAEFERGPHLAAARSGGFEECTACHGSHAVEHADEALLVGTDEGHCGACHAQDREAIAIGQSLHDALSGFDADLRAAQAGLVAAGHEGLFVEREGELLARARAVRGQAAPLVHTLSPQLLGERLERGRGLVAEVRDGVEHKQRELGDRQILVLVFFLAVLLLAAVLVVHAREVARRASGMPGAFLRARGDGGGG